MRSTPGSTSRRNRSTGTARAIAALNRDMAKDGFLLRVYGSLAVYEYAAPDDGGGTIDGTLWQLDVMPGYQIVRGGATVRRLRRLRLLQDSSSTPDDPTNPVRGTATGVKVARDTTTFEDDKQPFEASLVGEYSTAFDTYYAELRVGARLDRQAIHRSRTRRDRRRRRATMRSGSAATPRYAFELAERRDRSM